MYDCETNVGKVSSVSSTQTDIHGCKKACCDKDDCIQLSWDDNTKTCYLMNEIKGIIPVSTPGSTMCKLSK